MSQILHNHDFRWKTIYTKKSQNFVKICIATNRCIFFFHTKMNHFNDLPYKDLENTLLKLKIHFYSSFPWTFTPKERKNATKTRIYNKTQHFWSKKFTPARINLHNRWLWWLRHLEGPRITKYEQKVEKLNKKFSSPALVLFLREKIKCQWLILSQSLYTICQGCLLVNNSMQWFAPH